ncbi:MAG: type II secretion system protein [Phycisphaerae bacterium]|nr:type II secretion system protein [Phycisphaerae bacterium]
MSAALDGYIMNTGGGKNRAGFSLAEMMIALVVLGFGLLVIGAALPVGLNYSRQSVDLVAGDQAAEFAVDAIAERIRMKRFDNPAPGGPRFDDVFRPRNAVLTGSVLSLTEPLPNWEPRIKVRPFLTMVVNPRAAAANLSLNAISTNPQLGAFPLEGTIEGRIANWLGVIPPALSATIPGLSFREYDLGRVLPVLPVCSMVYPPIEVSDFDGAGNAAQYRPDDFNPGNYHNENSFTFVEAGSNTKVNTYLDGELKKMTSRRVVFAAFYRRVGYDSPGPDGYREHGGPALVGTDLTADNRPSDASTYEIIVIAMRKPSDAHRFALYNFVSGNDIAPQYISPGQTRLFESLTPVPVLAEFLAIPNVASYEPGPPSPPIVPGNLPTVRYVMNSPANDRPVHITSVVPTTLTFSATVRVGDILPPGSVFIPAVNDDASSLLETYARYGASPPDASGRAVNRVAGFVPHVPDALPIFEVLERRAVTNAAGATIGYEIIVKNDGFYPWIASNLAGVGAGSWPVWIIPQPFTETRRDPAFGNATLPVYENRSHILSVSRRIVTLPEVD